MRILILSVLSQIGAIENIVVDSGQSLTIACVYSGIYIDILKESSEAAQDRPNLLFLRIGKNEPNPISAPTSRPWQFNKSNSYYGSDTSENNKLAITLDNVEFDDEGVYLCKDVRKQVTASFRVTVVARPKSRTSFSNSLIVKDGSNSFNIGKCESTGAKPSVEIYWENSEGERVSTIDTKSVKRGKTIDSISHLTLNNVDRKIHHQQKYRCVVYQNNTVVFQSSFSQPVNVQWEPEETVIITEGTMPVNETAFTEGTEMRLICSSDANPKPATFEWSILDELENRTLIELDHWSIDSITLNSAVLSTPSLRATDGAITFVCSAKNEHGEQSYQVKLDIKEIPRTNAGPMGLLWALLGVIAVVLGVAVCMLINRWIQRRRSGIYKTEANHRDDSCDSLNDELQAAKKEYFM